MRRTFGVLLGILLPMAAQAGPETYACQFAGGGGAGWTAAEVWVQYDPGTGVAKVHDEIIERFVGKPVKARVIAANAKKLTVAWSVSVTSNSSQRAQMDYGLTIERPGLWASLRAVPARYDNSFRAKGSWKRK